MKYSNLQEKISIMQAFANGVSIEEKRISVEAEHDWILTKDPTWNWTTYRYRIAPPAPPLFEIGETQLVDGTKARIYALDAGGQYPIHGAYYQHGQWEPDSWTQQGRIYSEWDADHPRNLIGAI